MDGADWEPWNDFELTPVIKSVAKKESKKMWENLETKATMSNTGPCIHVSRKWWHAIRHVYTHFD